MVEIIPGSSPLAATAGTHVTCGATARTNAAVAAFGRYVEEVFIVVNTKSEARFRAIYKPHLIRVRTMSSGFFSDENLLISIS
jgi:hypothetical protein